MYRMEAKKSRRKGNLRRYIVFAVFVAMLLVMTTVVFGKDNSEPPEYCVSTAPAVLIKAQTYRTVSTQALMPTQLPAVMTAIMADGQRIGAVRTSEDAQYVLDSLITLYTAAHPNETDVAFTQAVELADVPMAQGLVSPEELYLTLKQAMDEASAAAAADDEQIAMTAAAQAPAQTADTDVIATLPLSISASRTETITEKMPCETETIKDGNMVVGAQNVDTDGRNGERIVTYRYTYLNGVMVDSEILKETVTVQPVSRVMRVGTKKPYAAPGNDGTVPDFDMPVGGRISSYYGMRRGRMHYGIDICTKAGTQMAASLGGRVTYAGERGNYGLLVEIDHGNGFVTRYAHNSKILVSVGQVVSKGKVIALIGETGNAACPHVHFEIRLCGSAVDPMPYLD